LNASFLKEFLNCFLNIEWSIVGNSLFLLIYKCYIIFISGFTIAGLAINLLIFLKPTKFIYEFIF